MSLFGPPCQVEIDLLSHDSSRTLIPLKRDSVKMELPLYHGNETVKGQVRVNMKPGKKVDHQGIKVAFVGVIELFYERNNSSEFTLQEIELEPAGQLNESRTFDFVFPNVEKQYDSYEGINVRLRYFVRFSMPRGGFSSNIVKTADLWVRNFGNEPEINNTIKMEVGIEDALHIEFEYSRSKYHLRDVIIGKIYFLLVRIKVKHMEIQLIKQESTGSGANLYQEKEVVTKFEIMDGAPVRGESIPIRMFLGGFDLTPTYRNINNRYSLRYMLNLVIVDEDDRRYFKQQEINLWRKPGFE
eukprot:GCRY01000866.1.p1 GENE.GCRY01000866.1~~GCRY01000866.1.p1  ORF type:complete len:299 (+),score=37.03 GCRY01000866.1:201-1097(+)